MELVFPAQRLNYRRDPACYKIAGREKLLGILFGVLARTLVPYLRKLKQGKVKKFWNGYWIQAVASLALGVMTTLLIFPQFNVSKPGVGLEASVKLFCLAFGFGFGCNSIIAEAAKWTEKGKTK